MAWEAALPYERNNRGGIHACLVLCVGASGPVAASDKAPGGTGFVRVPCLMHPIVRAALARHQTQSPPAAQPPRARLGGQWCRAQEIDAEALLRGVLAVARLDLASGRLARGEGEEQGEGGVGAAAGIAAGEVAAAGAAGGVWGLAFSVLLALAPRGATALLVTARGGVWALQPERVPAPQWKPRSPPALLLPCLDARGGTDAGGGSRGTGCGSAGNAGQSWGAGVLAEVRRGRRSVRRVVLRAARWQLAPACSVAELEQELSRPLGVLVDAWSLLLALGLDLPSPPPLAPAFAAGWGGGCGGSGGRRAAGDQPRNVPGRLRQWQRQQLRQRQRHRQ
jgi:hypothetical protein